MIDINRINSILEERKWHSEMGGCPQTEWFAELPTLLAKDIEETKNYIKKLSHDDLIIISEIFEDLIDIINDKGFIKFVKELHDENPDEALLQNIKWAEYRLE